MSPVRRIGSSQFGWSSWLLVKDCVGEIRVGWNYSLNYYRLSELCLE